MNPGVARTESADSFYQNKNSDVSRNLEKNRTKNSSASSLFFNQLSSFRGNFPLKSALPFDLPIRQAQEKLNFDQNDSLKELHQKDYASDDVKKSEDRVEKTAKDSAERDEKKFSKEVVNFLLDLKKFLTSLKNENGSSENLLKKINTFLEKIDQMSLKNHIDLKRFLQDVFNQFSENNGRLGNIQNTGRDIQKSLEGLLQRYQSLKVDGKLLDAPTITSSMVQKEKLENGSLKLGIFPKGEDAEMSTEFFNQRANKALLSKTTRHYSQGVQAPVNIGVMAQNRHNAMLQSKGGANFASSVIKGNQDGGVSHLAKENLLKGNSLKSAAFKGKLQMGQNEKGWANFRNSGEAKFNIGGKNIGVLGSSQVKNGLFTGGNNFSSEIPLSANQSQRIMDRIVGKVNHHYRAGQETFSLKLKPKELGNVDVWMRKQNGKVNLRLTVESHFVKETVESRLLDITNQLAQNGVELSALDVQVENHNHKKEESGSFSLKNEDNLNETKKTQENTSGADILESMQWSLSEALQRFYA